MTKTKKIAAAVTSCALLGALALGGTMAYLTDSEKQENKFAFGTVQVDLEEPNFADKSTTTFGTYDDKLVPFAVAQKDPLIENTGSETAVVFLKVEIPAADVQRVNASGAKVKKDGTTTEGAASEAQDLFIMKTGNSESAAAPITLTKDTLTKSGGNWYLINTPETSGGKTTYIFGYNTTLAENAKTDKLFDYVQLINMDDNSYKKVAGTDYASTQSINVYAYGIQATGLDNISSVTVSDGLTAAELSAIWSAYTTQNGTGDPADEANTNGNKNLKGAALGG